MVVVHVVAGAVALLAGYLALFTRKGAAGRRRAGLVFGAAMLVMTASAVAVALPNALLALPVLLVPASLAWWLWRTRARRERRAAAPAALRVGRRDLDEADFAAEIHAHLAMAEAELVAAGADRASARHAALRAFGNVTLTTEAARAVWTPRWLESAREWASDVRYAVRSLRKQPAFTITAVAVLALGIGLNAAVFSMLKGIALTPLGGVEGASRLAVIHGETSTGRKLRLSYPDYRDLRQVPAFAQFFGSSFVQATLGRGRDAHPVSVELVTGNYFHALGVPAALGRTLLPTDEVAPGRHPVVVISDGLWRRAFAADPSIVGRTLDLEHVPLTIVGVAAAGFHGTIVSYDIELFVPVMMAPQLGLTGGLPAPLGPTMLSDRNAAVLFPHGYLPAGTSMAAAASQLDAAWASAAASRDATAPTQRLRLVPFRQSPTGGQAIVLPFLAVLSAMGLLVLLIACANIAGLVLVRGLSRRGEIAVRLALGATRARVVRLLALENLVLALPGAALGLLLSSQSIPEMLAYADWLAAPQRLFLNVQVDWLVIGFAVVVALLCAVVFGLTPALQAARVDLVSVINEDASPRGAARGRVRSALVIGQVAVSLLLLVGAGLTSRSADAARRADPGFTAEGVATLQVDVAQNGYDEAAGRRFYRALVEGVGEAPGVTAAAVAEFPPLAFMPTPSRPVAIEGYTPRRGEDIALLSNVVGGRYFETLRIPIVAGRVFDDRDHEGSTPVALVNQTLAERFWSSSQAALGKRLQVAAGAWRTVVGVVADVKYVRIDEAPTPYVYLPAGQEYRSSLILHVRGAPPAEALVDEARAAVAALDADLPVVAARPLSELTKGATLFLEFAAMMLLVFGAAGLVLSGIGTYGLVAYTVRQSAHEIGIRMALGATRGAVIGTFVRRGLRLGLAGVGIGLVVALAASGALRAVLFGVSPTDPVAFAQALTAVLAGVAVATIVPAWRASRADPLHALRHQ